MVMLLEKGQSVSSTFGEKIKILRKEKGYTLDKLAELSESSKSYIWELENKNPPRPSADKLFKISAALGVTVDYLLETEDVSNVEDIQYQAFFRKYQNLEQGTKQKLLKMMELLGEDE